MPKKKTHEEFMENFKVKGNKNTIIIGTYVNSKSKILCKCIDCGFEWETTPDCLLRGHGCIKCGGTHKKTNKEYIDELFSINQNIKPLEDYISNHTKILHKCLICNYEYKVSPHSLLHDKNGCPNCSNNAKLNNTTYLYKLNEKEIAITPLEDYINANTPILHKCNKCGHEWKIRPSNILNLRNGCPVCCSSKGELLIKKFLDFSKISYVYEQRFNNLYGVGNKKLSYDFFILSKNIAIEFQGIQHFQPMIFGESEDSYKKAVKKFSNQVKNDYLKREYAVQHNIKLIEIPYWKFDDIEKILYENGIINKMTESEVA